MFRLTARLRSTVLIVAAGLLLVTGCDDPASPDLQPTNRLLFHRLAVAGDATLTLHSLRLQTDPVYTYGLGQAPNDLFISPNAMPVPPYGDLHVVNSLSHSLQTFTVVQVFNAGKFEFQIREEEAVDLGLNENTSPFAGAAEYGLAHVSNWLAGTVSTVDLDQRQIIAVDTVGPAPEGVVRDGDKVYVICSGYDVGTFSFGAGELWVGDATSGNYHHALDLGTNPQYGVLDDDGRLHIVCTGDYGEIEGEVWVVDVAAGPPYEAEVVDVGHSPGRIAIDFDNVAWLAAGGWETDGDAEGLILRYDAGSLAVLDPRSAGLGVIDVTVHPTRGTVYAACREAMRVDVFENGEKIGAYPLEDPPNAIEIWPAVK